jgi:hypothetical protein
MFWTSIAASSALLVAGVHAGGAPELLAVDPGYRMISTRMNSGDASSPWQALQKRQTGTGITFDASNSSLDLTAWNTDTSAACIAALAQLTAASNPSGTAVCYNIPSLETSSGVFMADLRLYQVAEPFAEFMGIASENIQVGLQYRGATVTQAQQTNNTRRDVPSLGKRVLNPTPLQTYMFVGQIDSAQLAQPMTI